MIMDLSAHRAAWLDVAQALTAEAGGGGSCRCPDDRCVGYHHGADEACGCTEALGR